jgi:putative FmdB family regulatory protein
MPTYDYKCNQCSYTFEEDLKIADRKIPTESPCVKQILHGENPASQGFETCGGEITQVMSAPYFAYDNIKTKHFVQPKAVGQLNDKLNDMKQNIPGNTL